MSTGRKILHLIGGPLDGQTHEVDFEWRAAGYDKAEPTGAVYVPDGKRWKDEHGMTHVQAHYEETDR